MSNPYEVDPKPIELNNAVKRNINMKKINNRFKDIFIFIGD